MKRGSLLHDLKCVCLAAVFAGGAAFTCGLFVPRQEPAAVHRVASPAPSSVPTDGVHYVF